VSEHIEDRVGLTLCKESVSELNVVLNVVNARFTAIGDDEVIIGRCYGTSTVADLTSEEV
jgi:hypothetical protein